MLKPHDVVVALKLIAPDPEGPAPTYARLSLAVGLSASETHASVARGLSAGLLRKAPNQTGRTMPIANRTGLSEFLVHGLKYVWPAKRGKITRGIPTATSNPVVATLLDVPIPSIPLVWPHAEGSVRGESVEPLCARAAALCPLDSELHTWLSLVDALRLREGREASLAAGAIERRLR